MEDDEMEYTETVEAVVSVRKYLLNSLTGKTLLKTHRLKTTT